MDDRAETNSPFPFTLWDEDAQLYVCEGCGAWAPEPGQQAAHNRTCKHRIDRTKALLAVARTAWEEVATKQHQPKSGIDYWASMPETEYTEAIPGIGRRIRMAKAVKALLATGWTP